MNPFDPKNHLVWILLISMPGFVVVFMGLGINLGQSLLSAVISIAIIIALLYLYIHNKTKKQKD